MGISFKRWLLTKLGAGGPADIACVDLQQAAEEYRIRELAFHTCVTMIANAIGKCEFKTYQNGKENKEGEYYLWNIEPNRNQNSTAFLHKLVHQLYIHNEALVITTKPLDGREALVVADSFTVSDEYPAKPQEYTGVTVGEVTYQKAFTEKEVLHFRLHCCNVKPVLDGLCQSYARLVQTAMKSYAWANGKHYKVHVEQLAQIGTVGTEGKDWNTQFSEMLQNQVKPFLTGENGVLPEFSGYRYEDVGGSADVQRSTRDIRALVDDIFDFTARALCIPPVLLFGDVAGTKDATSRWLTTCIDPLCDQLQEEIIRKRYGYEEWKKGNFLRIDTSAILHFDLFGNAASIEKLIGSGAFTINDVRKAAGQSEIDESWANEFFITKNFSTIEEMLQAGKGGE